VSARQTVRRRKRRATWLGVAAGALAAGALAGSCAEAEDAAGRYVTEPAERGEIAALVLATGIVEPVTTVQVGTYVSGPIREIHADFNSLVTKGQLVAKIDPAPFEVKVRQAEANLANARASLAKARAALRLARLTEDRNRELRGRDLVAQGELDTAESQHAQALAQLALEEAGVAQAGAALEEARINLAYTDIRSPVDGVVVSRSVDVGQTVAASFQTPTLFQIAQDLGKMQVRANVSESDIGSVREGQVASFGVDAYPDRAFEGRVVQVRNAPVTVQNVVTYDVVIEVDNPDHALKPGMTATVTIVSERREDALRVPLRALRFRPETDGDGAPAGGAARAAPGTGIVFVVDGADELRRVELRTGLRDDRFVEVLAGQLEPGDALAVAFRDPPDPDDAPARSPFVPERRR
jgi:HlyD family secretion protein